ncbi:MAG: DUF1778 domain-containing protein [Alteromonadaceae bacterium]|nr:DUF1778 domain-containing protein [Alteromonadaceae bacterium]
MRLSIDVTPEQHLHLKVAATLQGKSLKGYVLDRALPNAEETEALEALERILAPRVAAAKQGGISDKSVDDIFDEEIEQAK